MQQTIQPPAERLRQHKPEYFCRYLGLVALTLDAQTSREHIEQQIVTELAESIDAEMGTHNRPIKLTVIGGDLCDAEGRNMSQSAVSWSKLQKIRAQANPNLAWFAEVAETEAQEHKDIVEFAASARPGDVMVVASPFAEEAYANLKTRGTVAGEGFNPNLRRSFIRAYEKTADGLEEHIQSVDNSDLAAWNTALGICFGNPKVGHTKEILAQRTICTKTSAKEVIDMLAMAYDTVLFEKTSIPHRYGRNPGSDYEANAFVRNYPEIINDTIAELSELRATGVMLDVEAEAILYKSKALLAELMRGTTTYNAQNVRGERNSEGYAASARGDIFYGCSGASVVSHVESTGMRLGFNKCINCPYCKQEVTAYMSLSGAIECLSCKVKVNAQGKQIAGKQKNKNEKTFSEFIEELFSGDQNNKTKPRQKQKTNK